MGQGWELLFHGAVVALQAETVLEHGCKTARRYLALLSCIPADGQDGPCYVLHHALETVNKPRLKERTSIAPAHVSLPAGGGAMLMTSEHT